MTAANLGRIQADIHAGSAAIVDNRTLRRLWCAPREVDGPKMLLIFEYRQKGGTFIDPGSWTARLHSVAASAANLRDVFSVGL
mmetsp:Transcript_43577/g.124655  ORF Transcript_43577/g.124655 Transcript_43577/m.124655 type:complete len:83 (+) Transcript_43577:1-249(+)